MTLPRREYGRRARSLRPKLADPLLFRLDLSSSKIFGCRGAEHSKVLPYICWRLTESSAAPARRESRVRRRPASELSTELQLYCSSVRSKKSPMTRYDSSLSLLLLHKSTTPPFSPADLAAQRSLAGSLPTLSLCLLSMDQAGRVTCRMCNEEDRDWSVDRVVRLPASALLLRQLTFAARDRSLRTRGSTSSASSGKVHAPTTSFRSLGLG